MKKSRFPESKIISLLKAHNAGRSTQEICREHGISSATFYNWRKKYGGMDASQLKRLKELEEANSRLKKMYADLALDNTMLKDILSKKF